MYWGSLDRRRRLLGISALLVSLFALNRTQNLCHEAHETENHDRNVSITHLTTQNSFCLTPQRALSPPPSPPHPSPFG